MYSKYVYLILSENRLIIVDSPIDDKNYWHIFDTNSSNYEYNKHICNMLCIGYIIGSVSNRKIVNKLEEFK